MNDNEIDKLDSMPGSLSQPVIFSLLICPLPPSKQVINSKNWSWYGFCSEIQPARELLYYMSHCKTSWEKSYQGITVLQESLKDILGEVLPGENYCVQWPVAQGLTQWKLQAALMADEFMKDLHYYFSNNIEFLETYLFIVSLEQVVCTFSSSQKTKQSCLCELCSLFIGHKHLKNHF